MTDGSWEKAQDTSRGAGPEGQKPNPALGAVESAEGTGLGDGEFRATLDALLSEIDTLPVAERERLREFADATRRRQDQLRQTVEKLQETLDFLRLSIKYLVFDVEATKRENRYLRKLLDEAGGED